MVGHVYQHLKRPCFIEIFYQALLQYLLVLELGANKYYVYN